RHSGLHPEEPKRGECPMKRLGWIVIAAALAGAAPVTYESLTKAQQDPNSWLSYGKNYFGWRYSPLSQITTSNVEQLAPAWILPTGATGANETTPIVNGDMMFITGPSNNAWAIDLNTGKKVWNYSKYVPSGLG